MDKRYILKINWKSKLGYQEDLYLGRDVDDKIKCIPERDRAMRMTKEDAECWKLILANSKMWTIEEVTDEVKENNDESDK